MSRIVPALLGALVLGLAAGLFIPWEALRGPASLETIEDALNEPDGLVRAGRLTDALLRVDAETAGSLQALLESPKRRLPATELLLILESWAHHDPAAASAWAQQHSPAATRALATALTMEIHASRDPQAALRMRVRAPPDVGNARDDALVRGWVASGQPGIEEFMRALGKGPPQQRALQAYGRARLRRGEREALEQWVESLPDEPREFKLAAFRQIGVVLTEDDPARGVAWCDEHCDGPFGELLRQLVATRWAMIDARSAIEWISRYPDDPGTPRAVRDAFRGWVRQDRESALAFAEGMGIEGAASSWFRPAAEVYAAAIAKERPLEALEWAQLEPDPEQREAGLIAITREWRRRDEAAAEAWLETSPLSQAARDQVRHLRAPSRSIRIRGEIPSDDRRKGS